MCRSLGCMAGLNSRSSKLSLPITKSVAFSGPLLVLDRLVVICSKSYSAKQRSQRVGAINRPLGMGNHKRLCEGFSLTSRFLADGLREPLVSFSKYFPRPHIKQNPRQHKPHQRSAPDHVRRVERADICHLERQQRRDGEEEESHSKRVED